MFLIRQGSPEDFNGVYRLAQILDSYNLPADKTYIRKLLERNADSFSGGSPLSHSIYLFVIEEKKHPSQRGTIVGSSLIIAKHGIPGKPHLWFALENRTKKSRTLGIKRSHRVLRLGYTENGPREVGGLVILPAYRRHPARCGLQISYVRFLYMAMHPDRFERKVLVEYRGAMGRGNKSPFWERVGKVFTGLPYQKADHLSVSNKEFIVNLLPHEPIYCALLPRSVQEAIGAIHPNAQRAAQLLERVGFRRLNQIEPFDGGPYYSASRSAIRLVRQTRRVTLIESLRKGSHPFLIGTDHGKRFRSMWTHGTKKGNQLFVRKETLQFLEITSGESGYACVV